MQIHEEPQICRRLAVLGGDFGQVIIELVEEKTKYLRLITYSPKDLRYKANSVRLSLNDLNDVKLFLKGMLQRVDELIETIPTNKLSEDEMIINNIYLHYMIRRNKVETRLRLTEETGVGISLQLSEVHEFYNILQDVTTHW